MIQSLWGAGMMSHDSVSIGGRNDVTWFNLYGWQVWCHMIQSIWVAGRMSPDSVYMGGRNDVTWFSLYGWQEWCHMIQSLEMAGMMSHVSWSAGGRNDVTWFSFYGWQELQWLSGDSVQILSYYQSRTSWVLMPMNLPTGSSGTGATVTQVWHWTSSVTMSRFNTRLIDTYTSVLITALKMSIAESQSLLN